MKNIYKLLLIIAFIGVEVVKADFNKAGLSVDYTTVYKGDTINATIGYDGIFDRSIVKDAYDAIKIEYEGKKYYVVDPIKFTFDSDIFEINDKSEFKSSKNFVIEEVEIKTDSYGKTTYTFYLLIEDIREEADDYEPDIENNELYDGIFNDYVISNIKLKIKEKAEINRTYFLKVDDGLESALPITVIEPQNIKEPSIKINSCNPILGTLAYCNERCKVEGIGNSSYYSGETLYVQYENKEKVKKTIDVPTSSNCEFVLSDYFLIVGFDDDKIDEYYSYLEEHIDSEEVKIFKYNYNKIDNATKDMIDFVGEVPIKEFKSNDYYYTSLYYITNHNSIKDSRYLENLYLYSRISEYEIDNINRTINTRIHDNYNNYNNNNNINSINNDEDEFDTCDYIMVIVLLILMADMPIFIVIKVIKKIVKKIKNKKNSNNNEKDNIK